MIKKILILALLLISCTAYSQKEEKPVLDGLFELKLGMTYDEVMSVLANSKVYQEGEKLPFMFNSHKVIPFSVARAYGRYKQVFVREYDPMANKQNITNTSPSDTASVKSESDVNRFVIKDIELYWFDDHLVCIDVLVDSNDDARLIDFLKAKYGDPKCKQEKETRLELKTYAERTSEFDYVKSNKKWVSRVICTWKTNAKNITCEEKRGYHEHGAMFSHYLTITDTAEEKKLIKFNLSTPYPKAGPTAEEKAKEEKQKQYDEQFIDLL